VSLRLDYLAIRGAFEDGEVNSSHFSRGT
jgi:hypothetical protein